MQSQDLQLLLHGRASLIVVETFDEPKAITLLQSFLKTDPAPLFQWTLTEGLCQCGLALLGDTDDTSVSLEKALLQIKQTATPGVYVLCDVHPFMDEPKIIRLIKDIVFRSAPAHKLILLGPENNLPPELSRMAVAMPVALPNEEEILNIIRTQAEQWSRLNGNVRIKTEGSALDALVAALKGLPHGDVERLARAAIADDGAITSSDVPEVNKAKFSLMNMQGVMHFEYDTAKMSEVAGLNQFKRWLNERKSAFLTAERDIPKGVLLLGVQGGGKSLAAKAVAGLWQVPLLRLDMASLFNKFIGETEKNLREALALADALSPCVLWVDELEKGLAQTDSDGGLAKRILGTLLTWMAERKSRVFIVGTSNNIQQLPPELLRKGRFDEIFFVDLPERAVRQQIFRIHLQKRDVAVNTIDVTLLAEHAEGFTGAEIEQAIVAGLYSACARKKPLTTEELVRALQKTKPLSVMMAENMAQLRAWANERAVKAD